MLMVAGLRPSQMRPPPRLMARARAQSSMREPRMAAMPPIFESAAWRTSMQPPAAPFFHLQGDSPAPPGGVFPQGADLQRDGLLIVGGNAGVETSAQHFRRFPCLAKNPMRF